MGKRTVFEGRIFSVVWEELSLKSGEVCVYETVEAPDVVRVYPVFRGKLLLIREYRHELRRRITRTVSGRIEAGESPVVAAVRELREELGAVAGEATVFATSRPILKVRSTVHHVLVQVERLGRAALEPGEEIAPLVTPFDRLEAMVWDGEIMEDVVALQLLRLARMELADSAQPAGNAAGSQSKVAFRGG